MTTIASLLAEASQKLSVTSDTPRLDAEVLLARVRACSRLNLIRDANEQVDADQQRCFNEFLDRRIQHEPVAYIIGEKEFFGLSFVVNSSVLVPRPETELLVEEALRCADRLEGSIRILDLGTGSGCIAVALAETLKSKGRSVSILAVDSSIMALDVARANAQRHKVDSIIEFRQSDWFSAVRDDESFDIMVANPPYIAFGDLKVSPELVHEPQTALYATHQGFADINKILESLFKRPQFPHVLLLEVGESQAHELALTIEKNPPVGANIVCKVLTDLAGLPRIVSVAFCSRT
jgi:release factor glutamine methyltransferase